MSLTTAHIAIAGSGLAGLHCAVALSSVADVTVFERLPVPGGEHWEDREHRALIRRATDNGVRFCAGTQAIRWEGDRLLAIGEQGGVLSADALVVATGHRPSTRAELRIDGDRCGGVVPATLALHLLKQQVHLGDEIVVVGNTQWSRECLNELGQSARVIDAQSRVVATHGKPRIASITVESSNSVLEIDCDCLILGAAPLPYRNVDGAILDDAPAVYAQRLDDQFESPSSIGSRAARQALVHADREKSHVPVVPRIGPPR